MRRVVAITIAFALGTLPAPLPSEAQAAKVPRIALLTGGLSASSVMAHREASFRQGLHELGWIEGQNIVIETRYAEGRYEKLPELAAELVRSNVDVIVATGNREILAGKQSTTTVRIVMVVSLDPVGQGLIASVARPGGNITGLSWDPDPKIVEKHLEFLKEVVSNLSRVGGLIDPSLRGVAVYRKAAEAAAPKLHLRLEHVEVREPTDFEEAFAAMVQQRAQAIFVYGSSLIFTHLRQIIDLAAKHRLPDIYVYREAVAMGGLMSYGVNIPDLYRRAATYVDKILKGAKPADLPVEQPTRFELVINLKTAKALGLTIPQSIFIRADQVIQ